MPITSFFTNAPFEYNATLSVAIGLPYRCFTGVTHLGAPLPGSRPVCADGAGVITVQVDDAPVYLWAKAEEGQIQGRQEREA